MKVSHRITRLVLIGLAVLALAAPAASAVPASPDRVDTGQAFVLEPEAPVVQSVDDGFDWASAAIGAGIAGGIILLIVWGGVNYRHRHDAHRRRAMKRVPLATCAAGLALLLPVAPAGAHHGASSDAVSTWNINAGKAAVAACISPVGPSPAEARLYAMTHVAIHDALNAIRRRSEPYAYAARAPRRTSRDAAVATAARDVLVPTLGELSTLVPPACVDAAVAGVEADYTAALAADPGRPRQGPRRRGRPGRSGGDPRAAGERRRARTLLVGDSGLPRRAQGRASTASPPGHSVRVRSAAR